MLNLALLVLVVLVASSLWLLLRPPTLVTDGGVAPDVVPPDEGEDPAEPLEGPDVCVVAPPQSDERTPNH